jgi:cation diffusion facilitator family transporter
LTKLSANKLNVRAASFSVYSNTVLTLGKFAVGIIMASTAVISEGIHSGIDLLASLTAFLSLRRSGKPADKEHPFGHGRFENISGFVEGVLIFMAALLIIIEAVEKMINLEEIREISLGIIVMGTATLANVLVSAYLFRVARKTESIALEADAEHLRVDVITSLGVFGGLIAIQITDIHLLDPLIALAVAGLIIFTAIRITRKSFAGLVDTKLSTEEELKVLDAVKECSEGVVWLHSIKTRKAGRDRFIDLVLWACHTLGVEEAHRICDNIEAKIANRIEHTSIIIHVEPCPDTVCKHDGTSCRLIQGDEKGLVTADKL